MFEHVRKQLLVEAQVGYELLEVPIFLFQLLEPARFGRAQVAVLFLSVVVRGFADAHLSAYLGDGDTGASLARGKHELGLGKLGLFQDNCLGS